MIAIIIAPIGVFCSAVNCAHWSDGQDASSDFPVYYHPVSWPWIWLLTNCVTAPSCHIILVLDSGFFSKRIGVLFYSFCLSTVSNVSTLWSWISYLLIKLVIPLIVSDHQCLLFIKWYVCLVWTSSIWLIITCSKLYRVLLIVYILNISLLGVCISHCTSGYSHCF